MKHVEIYTDGACMGNPGPGGWGAVLVMRHPVHGTVEKQLSGQSDGTTTNNQMELQACIEGLNALKEPCNVLLTTDSQYVVKGMTQYMENWLAKNWLASKGMVKNIEYWKALNLAAERHTIEWKWVKGHNGHHYNELADRLATEAINR